MMTRKASLILLRSRQTQPNHFSALATVCAGLAPTVVDFFDLETKTKTQIQSKVMAQT